MTKDFFLCHEPTLKGGKNFWGVRLGAIKSFTFTPEEPKLTIWTEDDCDITLAGWDALRLLKAMGFEPTDVLIPSFRGSSGANPTVTIGSRFSDAESADAIDLPEPSWDCPLGTGEGHCTDLSECDKYQECAEIEDSFSPEILLAAKLTGLSPGEVLRRAAIAQGDEDDETVCPLDPEKKICKGKEGCEKYSGCLAEAKEKEYDPFCEDEDLDDIYNS